MEENGRKLALFVARKSTTKGSLMDLSSSSGNSSSCSNNSSLNSSGSSAYSLRHPRSLLKNSTLNSSGSQNLSRSSNSSGHSTIIDVVGLDDSTGKQKK